jgi:hypothetical protein
VGWEWGSSNTLCSCAAGRLFYAGVSSYESLKFGKLGLAVAAVCYGIYSKKERNSASP